MRNILFLIVALISLSVAACSGNPLGDSPLPMGTPAENITAAPDRWYFAEFLQEMDSLSDPQARQALADSFMAYAAGFGFPLTEDSLCHFLYRGNPGSGFSVPGDFNGWQPGADPFSHISATNLYYCSKIFPLDARLDYKFFWSSNTWILDPLNPHTVTGGFGPNSELRMPEWVYPWEIDYDPAVPHGTVQQHSFSSVILNNTRQVRVYLPPGYAQDTLHYPTIYVQDGGEYLQLASMVNVLDNLQAANHIKPIIAVFVNPVDRMSEYWSNADNYMAMLATELVPFVESQYRCKSAAAHRAMMGASLGGFVSLYGAFQRPETFGLSAGQSSSIWISSPSVIQLYANSPQKEIDIYIDWGTFEGTQPEHYQFIAVLQSKGYTFTANEYHEGHSWGNWRAHIDEILKAFWRIPPTGITPWGR